MTIRLSCLWLVCYVFQLLSVSAQIAGSIRNTMMTEDQAISILRSKLPAAQDAGFTTIRALEPTPGFMHVAQESWQDAQSKHLSLYGKGLFVSFLQRGGVAILEFNKNTDMAIRLHLVTMTQTGEPAIRSANIDGELSRGDALRLIDKNESFARDFFASSNSTIGHVLDTFGARTMDLSTTEEQGYFAIPEGVAKLAADPDEVRELRTLLASLELWPIRRAVSMPIYTASPTAAVQEALAELSKIEKEFLDERKENPGFVDRLQDLESIRTRQELRERLHRLKELNSFLEERETPADPTTLKANVSISAIPLELGINKQNLKPSYAVMTAPGLITIWGRVEGGEFVLKGVSEGE